MNIGLDFDETMTRDADFARDLIQLAKKHHHAIVCVTARRKTQENIETVNEWMQENSISIPVFFTSLSSKVEYMKQHNFPIDVWIDDDPKTCALGH